MNLAKIKSLIMEIIFPPLCFGCEKNLEDKNDLLCEQCLGSIKINNTLFCPVCQARIPDFKRICGHSSDKIKEFPFLLGAATQYDKPVQNIVHLFKYKGFEKAGLFLAKLMSDCVFSMNFDLSDFYAVPMPLHPLKRRKRGFNQSEILAKIMAPKFGFEIADFLVRIKNTGSQAKMKNKDLRKENIKNAFVVSKPEKIIGKKIIIVDDVYASGATMSEAAKTLKAAGAKKIIALVAAKT